MVNEDSFPVYGSQQIDVTLLSSKSYSFNVKTDSAGKMHYEICATNHSFYTDIQKRMHIEKKEKEDKDRLFSGDHCNF